MELRQLGGAVAREPRHRSAFCHRDAAFTLTAIRVPAGPDAEAVLTGADPAAIARCYDGATLSWLGSRAEQYDPAGVLRVGQVVRPVSG